MGTSTAVDINELLDTASLRAIQLRTLVVCTVAMMIDGYALYVVGWILPEPGDYWWSGVGAAPVGAPMRRLSGTTNHQATQLWRCPALVRALVPDARQRCAIGLTALRQFFF